MNTKELVPRKTQMIEVLYEIWNRVFPKIGEDFPDHDVVFRHVKWQMDNTPPDNDLMGKRIRTNNAGRVITPNRTKLPNSYTLIVDGREIMINYGEDLMPTAGRDGQIIYNKKRTPIILGANRGHPGEIVVNPVRNKYLYMFLALHPKNQDSPCWLTSEQQKEAGIDILPGPAHDKSHINFRHMNKVREYRKREAKEMDINRLIGEVMRMSPGELDIVARSLGVQPNPYARDPFMSLQYAMTEKCRQDPEAVRKACLADESRIEADIRKAMAFELIGVEDQCWCNIRGEDAAPIEWAQMPSDVTGETAHINWLVDNILQTPRMEFYREVTAQVSRWEAYAKGKGKKKRKKLSEETLKRIGAATAAKKILIQKSKWYWKDNLDEMICTAGGPNSEKRLLEVLTRKGDSFVNDRLDKIDSM